MCDKLCNAANSTKEDPLRLNWKIVDWDEKNPIKQSSEEVGFFLS